MANRRFIDFPIASSVGDNDIVLIWQDGLNKQTTKGTLIQGAPTSLEGLTDVDIAGLINGQILQYNSVTGKWENVNRTDINLSQLGDVSIVSPSNGQVLVYNSTTSKWENSSAGFVPYVGAVTTVDLGAQGLRAGYVRFNTSVVSVPDEQGLMYWDGDDETIAVILNGYIMKVGEDQFYPVKNQTGSSIAKGTAVRFAGTLGASGRLLIAPFIADGSVSSSFFMGVTAEAIANGADGKVLYFGRIRGINTNAFNEGDVLYASTTVAGGFQTAVPLAPNNIVQVAAVINKSINQGVIFIRPSFGSNINQDEGVKIVSPTTGQLLQLQANGLWENKTTAQIFGGTSSQFVKGDGTLDSNTYQVTSEKGQPNGYASLDINGKVPLVQINDALIGNVNFQGLWNASTNTPTLANPPASGTKGYYYIVSTAGTFASISFEVGDWIISDGTAWGKVDNTDAVSSVFGRTGNVVAANGDYTTAQVTESGNLYYTDGRARGALSFVAGSGAYNSTTGVITIPTNNNQITNGAGYITSAALGAYLPLTGGTLTGALNGTSAGFISTIASPLYVETSGADGGIQIYRNVNSDGGSAALFMSHKSTAGVINTVNIEALGSGSMIFRTGATGLGNFGPTRMQLTANGRLLIGSPPPTESTFELDVNGTGRFSKSGGNNYLAVFSSGSFDSGVTFGNETTNKWYLYKGNDDRFEIFSVGKTGGAGSVMQIAYTGEATFSSSVTATSIIRSGGTSSQYLMADGSVSTLSNPVTGTGTTNFLPKFTGASTIGNSLVFDDGTNVGIGTITPGSKFDVTNTIGTAYDASNTLVSGQTMRIANLSTSSSIASTLLFIATGDGGGNGLGSISGVNTGTGSLALTFATRDSGGSVTEHVRITSDGKLLIATTSSSTFKLDVNGTGRFTANLSAVFNSNSNTPYIRFDESGAAKFFIGQRNIVSGSGGTGYDFYTVTGNDIRFFTGSSSTTRLCITTSGSIGIGTTNPTNPLHVETTGADLGIQIYRNVNSDGGSAPLFLSHKSTAGVINTVSVEALGNGAMVFRTGATGLAAFGSGRMSIASGGNVMIGTGSANSKLQVNGSFALPHVTKSANYTLDATDYTVGFDCASNRTANLPDATTCAGRIYVIYQYNTNIGLRYVTIDGNGSQTINGLTTVNLQYQDDFSSVMIQSNGSNWVVIASALYAAPV